MPLPRGSKIKGSCPDDVNNSAVLCWLDLQSELRLSSYIVICRSIIRHFFVLVNAILAWSVTEIIHHLNITGRQGPSERRSRPRLRERRGPAAKAVGKIAPTGRTAPKAPAGITCPKVLWFQKWFLRTQRFKNHHWNLRIIKIFWNHLPFSGHFATFSGFARKFYIVLQPWLTHGQPVHNGACQY